MKNAILNNIIREAEAIRGYLIDPVEGNFILDEIRHIEELCAKLKTACIEDNKPSAEDGDNTEPDDDVDETSYNPYTGQNDNDL